MRHPLLTLVTFVLVCSAACAVQPNGPTPITAGTVGSVSSAPPVGYYRQPAIGKDFIVFVAEGDLWRVPIVGGVATRLTSHPGDETQPAISPDGSTVAFIAEYEGAPEVYTMPLAGGQPTRLTFDGARCGVAGWSAEGRVLAMTDKFSTLPNPQLTLIDPKKGTREAIPLWQASDGAMDAKGTLVFTRLPFQGSSTKRYKGGFIQQLWKWTPSDKEATALSADFEGTSKRPMWWNGRVYFVSDRDGTMNIWSMTPEGKDLKQHTTHKGFDVMGGTLGEGKIAYQWGADVWVLDVPGGTDAPVKITLSTDLDQLRERWVDKPWDYLTTWHLSPDGDRVVLTARGRVFVAPHKQGRIVDAGRDDSVRYRNARFLPDGKGVVAMSDKSGEVEIWRMPANGVGAPEQVTSDATVLRWDAIPSPDGNFIAHHDKNQKLWVLDVAAKTSTLVDEQPYDDFSDIEWSGDSRWLAYVNQATNMFRVIKVWSVETRTSTAVTTDRYDSYSPAWTPDGKWLYFLSDRSLRSMQPSPWGPNAPSPFLTETTKMYAVSLKPGERWPFAPKDELQAAKKDEPKKDEPKKDEPKKDEPPATKDDAKKDEPKKDEPKKDAPKRVEIALDGIRERLYEVPLPAGNYSGLSATAKALFYVSAPTAFDRKSDLKGLEIKNENIEAKTVMADINGYELSGDGKKLGIRKKESIFIVDAAPAPVADPEKQAVNLGGWTFSLIPRQQWRQMFVDSWRLMRDYFYDPAMHGVDWPAMREKYLPLVDRVTTRAELNDVIAQMVGELSALHIFVRGGDTRTAPAAERAPVASLGAVLLRDEAAGGHRVGRIYHADPDDPSLTAPLARPEVNIRTGDVIESIDGVPTLSVPDASMLLRHKAGKQVLLHVKPRNDDGSFAAARDAIAVPISTAAEADLRYHDWELSARQTVEKASGGRMGYVHLRAMGGGNYTEWARNYFPVFDREGLIIDVRHNNGGNIDSWILSALLRKAWFYWSSRVGKPYWNMQYAFRGHVVVLCDERTASDGEAFAEGFKRLGLGKVIGMRTWGGEIWLSSSNVLVDKGIASAAESGVFGPEGVWLVEGRGVEPDMIVDNPPHGTFGGEDAQLTAAIEHLRKLMAEKPVEPVRVPTKPDKSVPENRKK